jgi:dihydrofolate synthase / folylpolyglutamate synthase
VRGNARGLQCCVDYDDALRWLMTLPDFERTGEYAGRPDIEPMQVLLAELGDPHRGRPTVHAAGSKGKGSTAVMIESVLEAAGRRTGTHISPHVHRYTERIRIDGAPCSREIFARELVTVRDALAAFAGQFPGRQFLAFDALTAAAFLAFRNAEVYAQIIEVGLGGALDSTNVFHAQQRAESREQRSAPHVVVLTPISLEHTAILGDTIAQIAAQKAGIITDGCAVVVAPQRESALDVFRVAAAEHGAEFIEVAAVCQMSRTAASAEGQEFKLKTARSTYAAKLALAGRHQLDNAATAIVACEALAERCRFELTPQHVRDGLANVVWPGRLEALKRNPLVIIDGAHNGDSAKRMVTALREYFGLSHAIFLFGTLAGKDAAAMSDAIAPMADHVYVSGWPHSRAADPREVAVAFRDVDVPVSVFGDLAAGYEAATAEAGMRGAVVAFGSIAFVAALREYLLGIESDMIRLSIEAAPDAKSRP